MSSRGSAVVSRTLHRSLTLSSVTGTTDRALELRTLPDYFAREVVEKHPTRPALISRHEKPRPFGGPMSHNLGVTGHLAWDFDEFNRHIDALARGLLTLGVRKGDRVAVVMGNNSAYALLQWACASIGAILVTINPAYRAHELINTLKIVGVSHLFVVPRLRSSNYLSMLGEALPSLRGQAPGSLQEEKLPDLREIVVVDNTESLAHFQREMEELRCAVDFRELFSWREDGWEQKLHKEIGPTLKNDDVINLQFTSGTTGAPKAVSLTHSNLLNNGLSIGRSMHITEQDVLCNVPPLFHCFGLVLGNLALWTHGGCIVYPSEAFDPKYIVDAVVEEKCTALHGVPTHFMGVLAEVEKRHHSGEKLHFSRLRTGIAAGSPIPIELMKKLVANLNLHDLTIAYGMTETSPVSFQTTPADPLIKRVETVGKVSPHVKAKVIDHEGSTVPVGTPGEICVAGYLVQKGYWEDEDQTAAVMKKHDEDEDTVWMHTGDEGIMDEEGYLRIVGRIKDIIIRGGENLFPVQIENVLHAHPAIVEASAVSVPDSKYGEVVGAWILCQRGTKLSKEEVRQWVVQSMNPQNAPSWVWFLGEDGITEELPKTASGKVQKHILREWSKDLAKKKQGAVS
ncbi:hypothetical protein JAAARDRAFT_32562 [Jaapia argillacea MUCL 33604]|uniref:Acetyl-CoA synthetase-like protein n=1 Tax=Jaapia argillacea MUCL 33604 TaxID=933084 RepID=A0A067Q9J4_9AGAM|nr:hypothetical protein JAAARDRAFT_32562 [Jaapia argillacea MUCL 33604]